MNTLNLLWELESHNLILEQSRSKLEALKDNSIITGLETRLKNIENRYDIQRMRLENITEGIRKSENILKNHEFLHKEKKKMLYEGNIVDINQLEQLAREEEEIEKDIDDLESEIINNLQEIDLIEVELDKMETEIFLIREYREKQVEELLRQIGEVEEIILEEMDHISLLSSKIDKKTLNIYEKIRKAKVNAVVAVKDEICTGCNVRIPSYQKQPLNEGIEIVICESCGRIMYKEDL